MRIGIMYGATAEPSVEALVARAVEVENRGFATLWIPHIFGIDAITAAALAGQATRRIELGTAVVPSFPRHPTAMAQQALTANAAAGGRFTLGIGLSHPVVIENLFGLSYDRPARHMREYLDVMTPMLRGEPAKFEGDLYRVNAKVEVLGGAPVSLVLAALGPVMLGLAGRLCEGTITWMTGPKTLETHIGPSIRRAAQEAGRPEPRVIAGLPIALTNRPDEMREKVAGYFARYAQLPSYRAMLEREGAGNPGDVAMLGDETSLRAQVERLRNAGVTDFDAAIAAVDAEAPARTFEFLASLNS